MSFFTEGLLHLTKALKVLAGFRLDHLNYSRDNLITPAMSFDKTLDPLTWRFGGVWDIIRELALYAQVSRGADPLGSIITLSLFESEFKLATAQQYEAGLKTRLLDGRVEATLAGYYIVKKNLLTTDPADSNVTLQIGKQSSYGVEMAVGFRPLPQLAINANLALLDAQFDRFTEEDAGGVLVSRRGKQPPDVPELVANLWAVYALTPRWRLGGGLRHVGERFADTANTVREPPYTLFDAFLTYAPARFVNLTLRGRNLTDEAYAIAAYGPRS